MSHTLLSLIDPETGHPFIDRQKRLAVFTKMLYGGLRHSSSFIGQSYAQQSPLAIGAGGSDSLGIVLMLLTNFNLITYEFSSKLCYCFYYTKTIAYMGEILW